MAETEAELLERARDGDLNAFAEFVRLFERRVRSVLGRLLDDERDVDEAAQDTFVQAWKNLHRFRGDAAPFTWLYRIAVNEALQRNRKKKLDTRPLDEVPELDHRADPTPGQPLPADVQAAHRESITFLAERLRELPYESRAPLVLRDLEGWSYEQVAETLDLTVPAVKSRIHRARFQLGERYQAWLASQEA